MTRSVLTVLAALSFAGSQSARSADSYASEIRTWRQDYDRDLRGADGPFTLVARFVLKPGLSSVGRDASSDFVLPVEGAPAHVGKIDWPAGGAATFRSEPGVTALVDGKIVTQVALSNPVIVSIGGLRLRFGIRASQFFLAVHDPNTRERKEAKPSIWFEIDPHYRITADWIPSSETKTIRIADNDGGSREWKCPGSVSFAIGGKHLTLQAVLTPGGKQLSFFFRDLTTGHETYGAGRFLEADLPKDGKVVVDFNEAYNPSCAFNALYICPIPPKENHLPVRIAAGERNYPHPR